LQTGAGLLELLLALGVFMAMMPFAYRFALDQRDKAADAVAVRKIRLVKDALEQYIFDNKQKLLEPVSANITRVRLADLNLPAEELAGSKVQLRVVKSKDSAGRAFVQGVVIFDEGNMAALRTRQIAQSGGEASGFADGRMLYGAFGTWAAPMSKFGANVGAHAVLAETRPFRSGGDYLQRLPSKSAADATMQSDLSLGGHNLVDVKNIAGENVEIQDLLTADSIEATRANVMNRLDWAAPIEAFGEASVLGPITSDGRAIDAAEINIFGKSQFRSVSAEEMVAENLYLSGFSVAGTGPAILKISGTLDMAKGHVKAVEASVGFSGSVSPKLVVSSRVEDSANPKFFWDAGGAANLGDLQMTALWPLMRAAFSAERTGKTEVENIVAAAAANANATAGDYLRLLDAAERAVRSKMNK
jgi:hypothetical protein